ncbi:MAG: FAD-dependent oxidoreductase [Pedobacter sp.]|nr:MAG: FAD-dependent oxidoreductase [Pedobacter sp.]
MKGNTQGYRRDSVSNTLWENIQIPEYQNIKSDNYECDVLIIGAGITGLTTALFLQQQKKKVIIAEAYNVGFGTSGGTSAHINTFFDTTYPEIVSKFGEDAAKTIAKCGEEAISIIKTFVSENKIDCDLEFKTGYLFSENEKETSQLNDIFERSERAGVSVRNSETNGVPIPFISALEFPEQGQFHPLKYLKGLADAFVDGGGTILTNTHINDLSHEDERFTALSGPKRIYAADVIYATHIPPGVNLLSFRCAPYRSYVLGVTLKNERDYPDCLVYDMQEPYHYIRTHEVDGEKVLLVGGEDHKTGSGDPEEAINNLKAYIDKYFNGAKTKFSWSSQYYVPADGLPYIGPMPLGNARVYIATGFNGNGLTFGTIAGKILADQIAGKLNSYSELFDPSRLKPIAGFSSFVEENASVAYHFVADRFGIETLEAFKDMESGTGGVKEFKGEKLAVYKDEKGKIHALSPVCTHAGCIVNFNAAEVSWDCPCHGGRFDIYGNILNGPPRKPLEEIKIG